MFQKMKDSKASKLQERADAQRAAEHAVLLADAQRAYEAWQHSSLQVSEQSVPGVALRKGEVAYLVLNGVGLVEPRRAPGRWVGGSQGVSFRVAKGVSYRIGRSRGTYQQGEERPEIIDTGLGVVTNQRMIFVGSKRSTEWAYAKLLGFSLDFDGMAIFNVSNRQKASGFAYQPAVDHIVDATVMAAVAKFAGEEEHAVVQEGFLESYRAAYATAEARTLPNSE